MFRYKLLCIALGTQGSSGGQVLPGKSASLCLCTGMQHPGDCLGLVVIHVKEVELSGGVIR